MRLAPVTAQITLAKEIGENQSYQGYLVTIEQVKAGVEVGKAQAEALKAAEIKVIVTSGDANAGVSSAMDILSAKGGQALGGMLEAVAQTPLGKAALSRAGIEADPA